ncbi:hypothetical protein D3C85_1443730 [compost metagenome]
MTYLLHERRTKLVTIDVKAECISRNLHGEPRISRIRIYDVLNVIDTDLLPMLQIRADSPDQALEALPKAPVHQDRPQIPNHIIGYIPHSGESVPHRRSQNQHLFTFGQGLKVFTQLLRTDSLRP